MNPALNRMINMLEPPITYTIHIQIMNHTVGIYLFIYGHTHTFACQVASLCVFISIYIY